jgi:Transposase DNA-binding
VEGDDRLEGRRVAPWAEEQFGRAALGDIRRTRRGGDDSLRKGGHPQASLPEHLPDWADQKAAYRVLDAAEVSQAALLGPHWEQARAAARQRDVILLVQDTTEVDFTAHPKTQGLGLKRGASLLGRNRIQLRRQVCRSA